MTQIIFDERSHNWTNDMEYNVLSVKVTESFLNDFIKVKGGVYGHEIYDHLGIPYNRLTTDEDYLTKLFTGHLKFGVVSSEDSIIIAIFSPEDLIE